MRRGTARRSRRCCKASSAFIAGGRRGEGVEEAVLLEANVVRPPAPQSGHRLRRPSTRHGVDGTMDGAGCRPVAARGLAPKERGPYTPGYEGTPHQWG